MLEHAIGESDIDLVVYGTIQQILEQKSSPVTSVESTHKLNTDLGLSSLDLAQLIAVLEMKLNLDPFSELIGITSVRTVEDLCIAYKTCLSGGTDSHASEDAFESSQKRAQNRRQALVNRRPKSKD